MMEKFSEIPNNGTLCANGERKLIYSKLPLYDFLRPNVGQAVHIPVN